MKKLLMFVTTLALLAAVQARVEAAHYSQPAPGDPAVLSSSGSDPKLFEHTAFYPDRNLARALNDLKIGDNRIALFVPLGDEHKVETKGTVVTSQRYTEFMMVMADRNFGIDAKQLGASGTSPGILNMKDLTVELVTRESFLIGSRVVGVVPDAGAIVQMEWQEDRRPAADTSGRECWNQIFRAYVGEMHTSVGRRT